MKYCAHIFRLCLIAILLLLVPFTVKAQKDAEFIPIPAAAYPVAADSLPRFVTQLCTGEATDGVRWEAVVEFPELVALSGEETAAVRASGFRPGHMPQVEQSFGVSRKVGYLEISFVPVVERDGKLFRITSAKVTAVKKVGARAPRAAATERYAGNSVLASGKWVKIFVETEGIYQLTASRLREWGFANPERVKLYGYGGRILPQVLRFSGENALTDDLEEVPLLRRDGSLLFFAEGTVRWDATTGKHQNNHYSRYSYYFLTEGDSPMQMQSVAESTDEAEEVQTTVTGHALLDNDAFGWYSGGTEMFDSYDFINGSQHAFRVLTPSATGKGQVDIAFSAASTSTTDTRVSVTLAGSTLGSFSVARFTSDTESARETRTSYQTTGLTEQNNFTFNVTSGRSARLNFIRINYDRTLNAADAPYAFVTGGTRGTVELRAKNASAATQLWRIATAGNPTARITARLEEGELRARLPRSTDLRYVFVDTSLSSYPEPQKAADVSPQNLHADKDIDMVIVIPASRKLEAQATRLADAHTREGLNVRVVPADQIYNEFSSGTPDATAVRRYMKMLYDRASSAAEAPRYLLLFGDCAWDNRMLSQDWSRETPDDYLLAYEVSQTDGTSNSVGTLYSYVTDDYYGLLDDDEGANIVREKLDLGIGRLPCHEESVARIYVDKILAYLENRYTGAWKNRIIMMADNGDNNLHMNDCEGVINTLKSATADRFNLKKVYWDAYTYTTSATGNTFPQVTRLLQQDIREGAIMFNYTGHGSPGQISHCKLLRTEDFMGDTGMRMPLWVFASCEITPYDEQRDDIGRAALANERGGAVAVICASRSVFANYNSSLNEELCKRILGAGDAEGQYSMGDALRLSKVALVQEGADRSMNKMKYVLLGDPALRLSVPRGTVQLDSINGVAVTEGSDICLSAGQQVRFSGHVLTSAGTADESFMGEVTGTLFDREETITCKNNGNGSRTPKVYTDRTRRLFEISDSVRGGKFSLQMSIPRDISYSTDRGRLYLYAVDTDHALECHGFSETFHLDGTAETATDTLGPAIYLYLNSPDFPDGGIVGRDALLGATIADSAGINCSGISAGHDIELVLDGETSSPIVLNDYFSYDFGTFASGTLSYPMTDLEPGRHTLTLRAWDLNENSSTATLSFLVRDRVSDGLDVNATLNPASRQTSFITTLDAAEAATVTTEVFDATGRKVWAHTATASGSSYHSVAWNLTGSSGAVLPAGIYLYRARVEAASGGGTTKTKKLIIVKK
ncbi:MAG: type IX secretion system sortase PorU [Alloprevotella sp.]|nr:type IX secretion system sortase PorU [Alloprevotella sp.]